MPAGRTLDEEEKDEQEKHVKAWRERWSGGVVVGGDDIKTERKDASSLNMYS